MPPSLSQWPTRGPCAYGRQGQTPAEREYHAHAAEVAELADAPDSKSGSLRGVWVRFPPSASLRNPRPRGRVHEGVTHEATIDAETPRAPGGVCAGYSGPCGGLEEA